MKVVRVRSTVRRCSVSKTTGRLKRGGLVRSHTRRIK